MYCDECEEKIIYEAVVLEICNQEFDFCSKECRDEYISSLTTMKELNSCN